jgi:hypothetical protein
MNEGIGTEQESTRRECARRVERKDSSVDIAGGERHRGGGKECGLARDTENPCPTFLNDKSDKGRQRPGASMSGANNSSKP